MDTVPHQFCRCLRFAFDGGCHLYRVNGIGRKVRGRPSKRSRLSQLWCKHRLGGYAACTALVIMRFHCEPDSADSKCAVNAVCIAQPVTMRCWTHVCVHIGGSVDATMRWVYVLCVGHGAVSYWQESHLIWQKLSVG